MAITMNAKFSGKCVCGADVAKGARISYNPQRRAVVGCFECSKTKPTPGPDHHDMRMEDQFAALCGLDRDSGN